MINEKLRVSFSLKRRRVLIHRTTLRALSNPTNIRFLMNTKDKKVAVQSCEAIDRDNFVVPDFNAVSQFEITSVNFLQIIYKLAKWDEDKSYRIEGQAFARNRLVEFDLTKAATIADEEFVDEEANEGDKKNIDFS